MAAVNYEHIHMHACTHACTHVRVRTHTHTRKITTITIIIIKNIRSTEAHRRNMQYRSTLSTCANLE